MQFESPSQKCGQPTEVTFVQNLKVLYVSLSELSRAVMPRLRKRRADSLELKGSVSKTLQVNDLT